MAKMFYTLDEAKAKLQRSEADIKQFSREGRLREFRDGSRLMFKADQVDQLAEEIGESESERTYRYEAMNSSGQEVKDTVTAATTEEAIAKIRQKGYFPTKVREDVTEVVDPEQEDAAPLNQGVIESLYNRIMGTEKRYSTAKVDQFVGRYFEAMFSKTVLDKIAEDIMKDEVGIINLQRSGADVGHSYEDVRRAIRESVGRLAKRASDSIK